MQRTVSLYLASLLCLFTVSACSDNPASPKQVPGKSALIITPTETLDQQINRLLDLFPREMREHDEDRRSHGDLPDLHPKLAWFIIKVTYQAGLTRPALMTLAKRELVWLSDWVTRNAQKMNTPPNNESKTSAAARLVLYMSLYIYGGPSTPPPPYTPGADAIVGIVTPNAPATIVTPSGHAGVQLESGSVAQNTIVVITQNPTPFPANCSGPLLTLLCQYPLFYSFEQFPHVKLLKTGKFAVCHVNAGENRLPLASHDRFRLAHDKPANPLDYTTGSTIRDQNGESIEILPKFDGVQNFVTCLPEGVQYASALGKSDGLFTRFAKGVMGALTPKSAYAIDQGVGFLSDMFSNFNDVDPDGRPDRVVQPFTVSPVCGPTDCLAHPGTHLTLNYTIANIGTASTGDGAPGLVRLVQPVIEGPPIVFPLGVFQVGQIVPGGSVVFTNQDVVIPNNVPAGNYNVEISVGIGFFPEVPADLLNNTRSMPLAVTVDLNGFFNRSISDFAIAYHGNGLAPQAEGQVTLSALFTDEFLNAETFATRIDIDRRSILSDNVTIRNSFRDIQRARATLNEASMQWAQNDNISPGHAQLLAYRGFADVLVAENWCSGAPTSALSLTGAVVYGTQQSTTQLLQSAVFKFDSAIAISSTLGESGTTSSITARIGKARALLDLDDWTGAATAAASVPNGFSLGLGPSATENNGIYEFQNVQKRWTVSDNEGVNGLFYRSDEDSRIDFASVGLGFDLTTPVYVQLKYPNAASGTVLAAAVEARLIQAEASLRLGNLPVFFSQINEVRSSYGLSPIAGPTSLAVAQDILFKERAYSLWLTSHRLGDLRRLVRQYVRGQSTVFPTGEYPKGGVYGSDVNFPIPVDATFNPAGLVCFDRNP